MTDLRLDRALRDHYGRQRPSLAVVDRLRNATAAVDRGRRRSRAALAAAIGLIVLGLGWFGFGRGPDTMEEKIAAEISMNHQKDLSLDFEATGYPALSEAMDKLDFDLSPFGKLRGRAFSLLGGRYCSIQGNLAAQLRLQDSSGRRATLYQTRSVSQLRSVRPVELVQDGIHVELWREDGVFFALAFEEEETRESRPP